jgi:hypothetical protein
MLGRLIYNPDEEEGYFSRTIGGPFKGVPDYIVYPFLYDYVHYRQPRECSELYRGLAMSSQVTYGFLALLLGIAAFLMNLAFSGIIALLRWAQSRRR